MNLSTGVTLEFAERGHGNGQVVIFLHGYTDSWFSYSRMLELLPARYHGYALTQRGHGGSDKPLTGYEMSDFAADVVAFMDHFGIREAAIVGHSMGSVIAQRVAIEYPERVSELVLIGATPNAANEGVLGLLDFVLTLEDPIDPVFVREFQVSTTFQPVPEDFLDRVIAESLKVPARVWKDALTGLVAVDNGLDLARITAPTLIVYGDQDTVAPSPTPAGPPWRGDLEPGAAICGLAGRASGGFGGAAGGGDGGFAGVPAGGSGLQQSSDPGSGDRPADRGGPGGAAPAGAPAARAVFR